MLIILFPRRHKNIARCIDCGSHFERATPRHIRCRQCFMWMRGSRFVQLARRCFTSAHP